MVGNFFVDILKEIIKILSNESLYEHFTIQKKVTKYRVKLLIIYSFLGTRVGEYNTVQIKYLPGLTKNRYFLKVGNYYKY